MITITIYDNLPFLFCFFSIFIQDFRILYSFLSFIFVRFLFRHVSRFPQYHIFVVCDYSVPLSLLRFFSFLSCIILNIQKCIFHLAALAELFFITLPFAIFYFIHCNSPFYSSDIAIYFIISSNTAALKNSPGKPLFRLFSGATRSITIYFSFTARKRILT